ncbi:MAG: lipocalin family protein [Nitrospirae bacterium]|nr:lipocalin family protein [Nitrospirota bacterium]
MYTLKRILIFVPIFIMTSCMHMKDTAPPLQVVPFVDLSRYTGMWYEIARYPHKFQNGCAGSRATYALRDDGKLSVLNECYEEAEPGKLRSAKGKAWVVDSKTNAKLKVSFFWPFSGAYWIIDLGRDYEYAVIGHPDRQYLWILSRTQVMDESVYEAILNRLKDQHYDTSRLIRTAR